MIRLNVVVTDTSAPVLQQGKGLLIITIIDVNEMPPVSVLNRHFLFIDIVITVRLLKTLIMRKHVRENFSDIPLSDRPKKINLDQFFWCVKQNFSSNIISQKLTFFIRQNKKIEYDNDHKRNLYQVNVKLVSQIVSFPLHISLMYSHDLNKRPILNEKCQSFYGGNFLSYMSFNICEPLKFRGIHVAKQITS